MKKSSATIYSPAMELPVISRRLTRRANRNRISSTSVEELTNVVPPPSEETIERLNHLAKQYPFCVCYKAKDHDPL
jgi:histone H3/H4